MFGFKKKKENKRDVFEGIIKKAQGSGKKIVLPEGHDPRVIEAAEKAALLDICKVVIIGDRENLLEKFSKTSNNQEFIDQLKGELWAKLNR